MAYTTNTKVLITVISVIAAIAAVFGSVALYRYYNPMLDANGFPVEKKNGDTFDKGGIKYTWNGTNWVFGDIGRMAGRSDEYSNSEKQNIRNLIDEYDNRSTTVKRKSDITIQLSNLGVYPKDSFSSERRMCTKYCEANFWGSCAGCWDNQARYSNTETIYSNTEKQNIRNLISEYNNINTTVKRKSDITIQLSNLGVYPKDSFSSERRMCSQYCEANFWGSCRGCWEQM